MYFIVPYCTLTLMYFNVPYSDAFLLHKILEQYLNIKAFPWAACFKQGWGL